MSAIHFWELWGSARLFWQTFSCSAATIRFKYIPLGMKSRKSWWEGLQGTKWLCMQPKVDPFIDF